jgi:hypothetical protein
MINMLLFARGTRLASLVMETYYASFINPENNID